MTSSGALPRRVRAGYGAGSIATGSFGAVPGLMLLPLLTDSLGVSAALAGLLVFVPKAWDVVLNPIVGRWSDRRGAPARARTLLRGGLSLAVLFALMLAGPHSPGVGALWVVVLFVACATAYAFFQVPYMALPAELTDSYDERTRLMTWRVAVLAVAILVSGGVAPLVRGAGGYAAVGVVVGLLIAAGATAAWWGVRDVPLRAVAASDDSFVAQLRVVRATATFRRLILTWMVQALATGAMLAGVDYVARHVLRDEAAASLLFVCFVAPALLVTPLWQRWAARHDKKRGYVAASLVFAGSALLTWLALDHGVAACAVSLACVGVGYAGIQLFPMAMLPDEAAADAARHGVTRVGLFTGVWTAAETLGLALGPFVFAAVLAAGSYASSSSGSVAQTPRAVDAIALGFTAVPAALVVVSLIWLLRYPSQCGGAAQKAAGRP